MLDVDLAAGRIARRTRLRRRRLTSATLQLDIFTLVPHAFAWMTEQRPLAAVLGTELELRLFNYRDTTPLRAGQVDDEPYGGGAGHGAPRRRRRGGARRRLRRRSPSTASIALTPQGRPLTQAVVEELATEQP